MNLADHTCKMFGYQLSLINSPTDFQSACEMADEVRRTRAYCQLCGYETDCGHDAQYKPPTKGDK